MRLARLLIFSGLDQDDVLLPEVCLATRASVVIFHSIMCLYELL
jgi:hypothetical protein